MIKLLAGKLGVFFCLTADLLGSTLFQVQKPVWASNGVKSIDRFIAAILRSCRPSRRAVRQFENKLKIWLVALMRGSRVSVVYPLGNSTTYCRVFGARIG